MDSVICKPMAQVSEVVAEAVANVVKKAAPRCRLVRVAPLIEVVLMVRMFPNLMHSNLGNAL